MSKEITIGRLDISFFPNPPRVAIGRYQVSFYPRIETWAWYTFRTRNCTMYHRGPFTVTVFKR